MTKVLICNAYYYWLDEKQLKTGQPYPPLGTLYAASNLRTNNYEIIFHDNNLKDSFNDISSSIDEENIQYVVIYDDGFNYLTKMCLTNMREATFKIIKEAKSKSCKVILNSSDSTDHFESYHAAGADYVIHGEGELALLELINTLESGHGAEDLLGISQKRGKEILKNPKRPVLKNLDDLPMAAWDLVDMNAYREIWMKEHGYFSLNLATTRGCPYKCNWCAKPIYGNRYNSRSPQRVVEEISYLMKEFDVDYFWMCDDIFGLKPNWVKEFKTLVQKDNLKFKYKIQSRVDLMLKEDQIEDLIDSGADMIWVGAESGSQKILDAMDKGTQVEQIYEATRMLKKKGARIGFFLQFGYLGENWKDIQKTIQMVTELLPDDIGISVSYPLPGTKFYEKVKFDLVSKANWTDSDDLDLMFKNNYKPSFYKTLHRYVHNRYRMKKAVLGFKNLFKFESISKQIIHILRGVYHLPQAMVNRLLLKFRAI